VRCRLRQVRGRADGKGGPGPRGCADALTNGWIEATGFTAPEVLKDAEVVRAKMAHAIVLAVRATAAKGG